jgi:hypothetical protein
VAKLGRWSDDRGSIEDPDVDDIDDVDRFIGERHELPIAGRTMAQLGEREDGFAVALDLLAHAPGHRREDLFGHDSAGPGGLAADLGQVPQVGAAFDLAQRAVPVRVVRAKLLLEHREPVTQRGVANRELADLADLALDVGVQIGRRLLLDAQEVLFVQDPHAIEGGIERLEQLLGQRRLLGLVLPRLGRHVLGG